MDSKKRKDHLENDFQLLVVWRRCPFAACDRVSLSFKDDLLSFAYVSVWLPHVKIAEVSVCPDPLMRVFWLLASLVLVRIYS